LTNTRFTGPRLVFFPIPSRFRNLSFLHPQEKSAFDLIGPARRSEWLAVRWGLKWLARQQRPQVTLSDINTVRGAQPVVELPDGARWFASAAHDRRYVLAAVAEREPLGVDIETPSGKCRRLAQKYCPQAAGSDLCACRWWTAQEALAKASGASLTLVLRQRLGGGDGFFFRDRRYFLRFWKKAGRIAACCSADLSEAVFLAPPEPADIGAVGEEDDGQDDQHQNERAAFPYYKDCP